MIRLTPILSRSEKALAQNTVTRHHYLHRPVDTRCSVEGYWLWAYTLPPAPLHLGRAGLFLLGRPEATRVNGWYGSVQDVHTGKCQVTRWQILNLARVWIDPAYQPGGKYYNPANLPGFTDRRGIWRSTAASAAIQTMLQTVGFRYLVQRPPVFLDEPYEIKWLISYCDTKIHTGTLYRAAGFELYRTNANGIQTWRIPLPPLTPDQHKGIINASQANPRAQRLRALRAQPALF